MPIIDYAIPCLLSSVDQRSNSVSLFSVIENIDLVEKPNEQPGSRDSLFIMEFITLWRRLSDEKPEEPFEQVVTLRKLQRQIVKDRLVLTVPDAKRIVGLVERYGQGGYQGRLKRIVEEIHRQLPAGSHLPEA